jgi:hypothetical protein
MADRTGIDIKIGVDAKKAQTELKKTGRSFREMGGAAKVTSADIVKAGAALAGVVAVAAGVVRGVDAVASSVLQLADRLNLLAKSAREVGASASELQEVTKVLGLMTRGGVDGGRAIQELQRRLVEAAEGGGEAADTLAKLGISLKDLSGRTLTQQLELVADRIGALESPAERSAASMELFGRQGRLLVPAFSEGGAAVADASERVRDAGLVADEYALSAEVLSDEVALLTQRLETLRDNALGPLLSPMAALVASFDKAISIIGGTGGLEKTLKTLATGGALLAADKLADILTLTRSLVHVWELSKEPAQAFGTALLGIALAAGGQFKLAGEAFKVSKDQFASFADGLLSIPEDLREIAEETNEIRLVAVRTLTATGSFTRGSFGGGGGGETGAGLSLGSATGLVGIEDEGGLTLGSAEGLIKIEDEIGSVVEAGSSLTDMINGWGGAAEDAMGIVGDLFDTFSSGTKVTMKDMGRLISRLLQFGATTTAQIISTAAAGTAAQASSSATAVAGYSAQAAAAAPAAALGSIATFGANAGAGTAAIAAAIPAILGALGGLVGAATAIFDGGITPKDMQRAGFTGRQSVIIRDDETVLKPSASSDADRIATALATVRGSVESGGMGGTTRVQLFLDGKDITDSVETRLVRRAERGTSMRGLAL